MYPLDVGASPCETCPLSTENGCKIQTYARNESYAYPHLGDSKRGYRMLANEKIPDIDNFEDLVEKTLSDFVNLALTENPSVAVPNFSTPELDIFDRPIDVQVIVCSGLYTALNRNSSSILGMIKS